MPIYCTVWLLLILHCSQTRSAMQCCVSSHTSQQARNSDVCSSTVQLSSLLVGITDPHSILCGSLWQAVMRLVQFTVYHGYSCARTQNLQFTIIQLISFIEIQGYNTKSFIIGHLLFLFDW